MESPIPSLQVTPSEITAPFLPNRQKKTLFISVFHTMIHGVNDSPPDEYDFSVYLDGKEKTSSLYVILRPGLEEFLHAAKKAGFEIVTFSWWPREYVSAILGHIDPTREIITHQLYLDYNHKTGEPKELMDIHQTGRMLDRSVVIDGNRKLFVRQWCNVIKVSVFKGDSKDAKLWGLLRFLEAQENYVDVRDLVHVRCTAPLLPVLPLPSTTRRTLFLDLDETLICNLARDCNPPGKRYIMKRPGIDKLLRAATESDYEIVIFTAGDRNYASPIIDKLDPKGLIKYRLYEDSCKINKEGKRIKDLSLTGRSLERCIMVDDVWQRVIQTENVVRIKQFNGDTKDSELIKLLPYFSIENKDEELLVSVACINRNLGYLNHLNL